MEAYAILCLTFNFLMWVINRDNCKNLSNKITSKETHLNTVAACSHPKNVMLMHYKAIASGLVAPVLAGSLFSQRKIEIL